MFPLPRRYSPNLTILIVLVEVCGILSTSAPTAQSTSASQSTPGSHQPQQQPAYNLKKSSSNSQSSNSASRAVKTTVDGDELYDDTDAEHPAFLEEGLAVEGEALRWGESLGEGTGCDYKFNSCGGKCGLEGFCCEHPKGAHLYVVCAKTLRNLNSLYS